MIYCTLSREESDRRTQRRPTTRILTTDSPRTVLSKLSAINLFIASSIKQKTGLLLVTKSPIRDDLTKLHNDNLVSEVIEILENPYYKQYGQYKLKIFELKTFRLKCANHFQSYYYYLIKIIHKLEKG